jgi:hypothetical protein
MSSREPLAWVLNLDAEEELAHVGAHTPTLALTARVQALIPVLRANGLLGADDVVVWPGEARAEGLEGRAWCPTPWALAQLAKAGAKVPNAPNANVLLRVNHRRFSQELGQALPGAGYASDAKELEALLARPPLLSSESCWVLKRPLGYAGRGRRKLFADARVAADDAWIEASLRADGLQVEPWVQRELDVGLHGFVTESGALTIGRPTVQDIDAQGTWRATRLAAVDVLSPNENAELTRTLHETGGALHEAGYFGPFGIDAFRWRAPDGAVHFQPRSEINARYSMGWSIGSLAARS